MITLKRQHNKTVESKEYPELTLPKHLEFLENIIGLNVFAVGKVDTWVAYLKYWNSEKHIEITWTGRYKWPEAKQIQRCIDQLPPEVDETSFPGLGPVKEMN